jgi:branched-chain amino acid transport system permease protein
MAAKLSAYRRTWLPIALVVALALSLAAVQSSGSGYIQGLAINIGLFMILVVSLNLFNGFTGVFSLGHIGFMALGAYITAILTLPLAEKLIYLPDLPGWLAGVHFDWMLGPFPLGFLLATLVASLLVALVALVIGLVLMRLSGHFVAVATLGFLVIVRVVLINAEDFTRGSRTFSNVTPYTNLWWVWIWVLITVFVVWRIKVSPFGRRMFAQREDRWASQSIGISTMPTRLQAFVISAFFTSVAGSLYAHYLTSFSPNSFYFDLAFRVIIMMVVGGMGSVTGAVLGTGLVYALDEILRNVQDRTLLYGLDPLVLALIFLGIIVFRPEGLVGQREILPDPLTGEEEGGAPPTVQTELSSVSQSQYISPKKRMDDR